MINLQDNHCLNISLNIHVKQIKTIHEVERHNEIRIIIPNQYMTSL